jgi:hypothetical protein
MTVRITALLDEAQTFRDTLHVVVTDGDSTPVALEATGTGNTVVCEELAAGRLEFASQLCGRAWQQQVVVCNMGRRSVSLAWTSARVEELAKASAKQSKGSGAVWMGWASSCWIALALQGFSITCGPRMGCSSQQQWAAPLFAPHAPIGPQTQGRRLTCQTRPLSSQCHPIALCWGQKRLSLPPSRASPSSRGRWVVYKHWHSLCQGK